MTRQNGVYLESSGKIENFQQRSFRKKKKAFSVVTGSPKQMMGDRQENNGRRFDGLLFWDM